MKSLVSDMAGYIPYGYNRGEKDKEAEKEEELRKEMIVRQFLTREARERLANLALVNPELVKRVKDLILSLALSNRINEPITDSQLKKLLYEIQRKMKKEYRFRGLW